MDGKCLSANTTRKKQICYHTYGYFIGCGQPAVAAGEGGSKPGGGNYDFTRHDRLGVYTKVSLLVMFPVQAIHSVMAPSSLQQRGRIRVSSDARYIVDTGQNTYLSKHT